MKIAVSSYSFSGAMRDGRMSLMNVIPKAKEMGFDGIEIADVGNLDEIERNARALAEQSKAYEMPIVAYMTGADFLKNPVDGEIERLRHHVELAATLGAPKMRHDAAQGVDANGEKVSFEQALPRLADGYRGVTEFAAGLGLRTMIENHGFFAQDAERVRALIERVGHPNFGWLVDMGNFLCADENPTESVAIAAPYAFHAHAKDFHIRPASSPAPNSGWFASRGGTRLRGAIVGHGNVDVAGCVALLKKAGYDEWLSIEFEGIEDCLMAIPEGLANLKSYL